MNRYLNWDESPGEVRIMLHDGRTLQALRLFRTLGGREPLFAGMVQKLRLGVRIDTRRALVHGSDGEAEVSPVPDITEGSLFDGIVLRPAIAEPGRWKRAMFRPASADYAPPRSFLEPYLDGLTSIACKGQIEAQRIRTLIGDADIEIVIDAQAIEDTQFDLWCDRGIAGEFVIEGGLLTIERTRAITMIDIDGYKDARQVNLAAARAIPWLIGLYGIGGQVGIDFLATANKAERAEIDAALAKAAATLPPHERTSMNGFGFVQMVLPRSGPNVMEQLCGTKLKQASVETLALQLLRAAGCSTGHGKRQLVAKPAIIDLIRGWPEETGALRSSLGVAIELVSDSSATGYGHVHVSQ